MNAPPPPPPPHGSNTGGKSSGLPPGNYDIFIIPPHSSGSGFLYLPSLQPHRNSFLAGVACTLFGVAIWSIVTPIFRDWFATIMATGGMGVVMLLVSVGVAGWAWGKTQLETGGPGEGSAGNHHSGNATGGSGSQQAGGSAPGGPPPGPMPGGAGPRAPPKPTWQRANTGPGSGAAGAGNTRGGWEKAREETRKKEEERKKSEELRKKREEEEKERVRQRERDAQERLAREREFRQWQARKEAEEKETRERETQTTEAKEREAREKQAQEKQAQEREAREKEAREKDAREKDARERDARERREREYKERIQRKSKDPVGTSPSKTHQQPTASTATDDASSYSFRPYDKLKRPVHKATSASSMCSGSESSYAPSQTTARTTPPPSHRGPYHTKDPDKIVLKAVYSFNNTFTKLPIAQLVSGVGSVTDGLILRITTEGLFIDDDVRDVPQREWDVKAWTLKLVEVWCPPCGASSGSTSASARNPARPSLFGGGKASTKMPTSEESDAFLENLLRVCKSKCNAGQNRPNASASSQSGEQKGLHVLRASIRDQEGKRYVFVLQELEGWKVAVGLQRLRRGTQVRALGVSGMTPTETRTILEGLGWG